MVGHLPLRRWGGKTAGSLGQKSKPSWDVLATLTGALAEAHGSKEKELTANYEIQAGTWASTHSSHPTPCPREGAVTGRVLGSHIWGW